MIRLVNRPSFSRDSSPSLRLVAKAPAPWAVPALSSRRFCSGAPPGAASTAWRTATAWLPFRPAIRSRPP